MSDVRAASRLLLSLAATCCWVGLAGPPGVAFAEPAAAVSPAPVVQEVVFDLTSEGRSVGKHTLGVRHIPPRNGAFDETRILESYEEVGGADLPEAVHRRTRTTARADGSTMSFTAITELGPHGSGRITEVNARRMSDGSWFVNITQGGEMQSEALRRSQADLCTLDLLDPKLHARLLHRSRVRLLDHTTGAVLEGEAEDLGEVTIQIGEDTVPVRRSTLKVGEHIWQWDWNLEGLLVRYDVRIGGQPLSARVNQPPPPRQWGAIDISTRFDNGTAIQQDDL